MEFSGTSLFKHQPCSLVTGALGFVGLHLVRGLIMAGQSVVGFGRLEPGQVLPPSIGSFRLARRHDTWPDAVLYEAEFGAFWFVSGALEDAAAIRDLVDRLRPVMIYHLAAQSSAAVSFANPGDTFVSNVIGTLNLLEAVRAIPDTERPIVLSVGSAEEYGARPETRPLAETTPCDPVSPYGVSKLAQTALCRQYARSYDLPIIMTRSFSHTGPGHDTRFAFPSFARQIAAAEAGRGPATILTGDLSAVRDFLDVRDVVYAYRLLMKEGQPGEIYNVSSGSPLTIQHGLEILVAQARCEVEIRQDPDRCRPSDIPYLVGDNRRLRAATGWSNEWHIEQTLAVLLEQAREEIS